ncbi:hypothetical protein SDC9_144859 [bioreactor metagenome]|uniref:Uncharacterized protein n=1 Tax=bioreactor metagenome TaxID=1076179 RepID=A0A645EAN9_9ZZZZ
MVDVLLGGDFRMGSGFDRVLFGGQPEGVPAHRMKHVEALHALVAADDVGRGVAFGMTHVKAGTGRIREHIQRVIFGFVGEVDGPERFFHRPARLPFGLDGLKIVFAHDSIR